MDCASRGSPTTRSLLLFSVLAVALGSGSGCVKRTAAPRDHDGTLAAIAGRMVSLAGLPLTGGEVVLDQEGEAADRTRVPVATERLSPAGTFRILNVPPGRYRLRGHAPGHADSQVRLDVRAGETLATVLRLAQAETLGGKVVDHRGEPVPAARLLIWSLAEPDARPGEAFTDAQGRFALGGLDRGPHRLIAEAPGFGSMQKSPIEIPSSGVVLAMEADGRSISGLVTAAGRPAGGARVLVGGENLSPSRQIAANADGSFLVHGLGPGVYVLRASRGDQVSATSGEVVIEPSGERSPPVRLELAAGWAISGRVVDDTGRPSPGSEVRIDAVPGEDPLPEVVRADEAGVWKSGPLPMGEYRLTPRRPGFVARRPLRTPVGPRVGAAGSAPLLLELVRGAQISGRVVDQRGAPVADATVRCVMPGREDLSVIGDRLPLAAEAAASPSGSGHALGPTRTVSSDSGGHFQLLDMLPGRFFLDVSRDGSVPQRAGPFPLVPGQRLESIALTLLDGVRLTGRVTDENDQPIDGARIAVRRLSGPAPARGEKTSVVPGGAPGGGATAAGEEAVLVTDGGGRFTAAVAAGESLVAISAAGMLATNLTVRVAAGSPPAPLAVRLGRAAARFDGLARDTSGREVVGAQATAWPIPAALPDGELPPLPDGAVPLASAVTDAGGHFQLTRLPRGRILIEVKHAAYPRAAEIVTTSEEMTPGVPVTIRLAVPGGIEGEVRETVSGALVSNYRIEAHGPEGRVASATRKSGARFVLARLFPGRWTLTVRAPGYDAGEKIVDVAPSATLGESSVRELRIELAPGPRN